MLRKDDRSPYKFSQIILDYEKLKDVRIKPIEVDEKLVRHCEELRKRTVHFSERLMNQSKMPLALHSAFS